MVTVVVAIIVGFLAFVGGVCLGEYLEQNRARPPKGCTVIVDGFGQEFLMRGYSVKGAVVAEKNKGGYNEPYFYFYDNTYPWDMMISKFPAHKAEFEAMREAFQSEEVSK